MSFRALVLTQGADRKVSGAIETLDVDRLPAGDVTVAVDYSTLNYKDGLVLTSGGGLVKTWPHVGGIDFAGTVEASDNPGFQARRQGGAERLAGRRAALGRLRHQGAGQGRLAGQAAGLDLDQAGDGDRHGGLHLDALRDGAAEARRQAGSGRGAGDRRGGRRRLGRRRDPGQARLPGRRRHRPAAGGRLSEGAGRRDHHRPQGADRGARPAAPVGALCRRGRHGVGRDVRQGARPGEVRRRGRGVRPGRRAGVPGLDPALHPARRVASTASIR